MSADEFLEYWNKHYPQNEKPKKVLRKNTGRGKDRDQYFVDWVCGIGNRLLTKKHMAIKPQAIRKGVIVKFDNVEVDKQTVITASETWSPNHETLFKKLLQQGCVFKMNGVKVEVIPAMKVLNSKNEPEMTAPKTDPLARF